MQVHDRMRQVVAQRPVLIDVGERLIQRVSVGGLDGPRRQRDMSVFPGLARESGQPPARPSRLVLTVLCRPEPDEKCQFPLDYSARPHEAADEFIGREGFVVLGHGESVSVARSRASAAVISPRATRSTRFGGSVVDVTSLDRSAHRLS